MLFEQKFSSKSELTENEKFAGSSLAPASP